jgi:hypothetical protein
LQRLVLVQLQPGFDCPHVEAVQEGLAPLQAAAAAAAAACKGLQSDSNGCQTRLKDGGIDRLAVEEEQQQQQHALQVEVSVEHNDVDEPAWTCTHESSESVWGVYALSRRLVPVLQQAPA